MGLDGVVGNLINTKFKNVINQLNVVIFLWRYYFLQLI